MFFAAWASRSAVNPQCAQWYSLDAPTSFRWPHTEQVFVDHASLTWTAVGAQPSANNQHAGSQTQKP